MNSRSLDARIQDLLGLVHANRLTDARNLGMKLRAAAPGRREVISILGAVHGQLGEFAQAESCYSALVAVDPRELRHQSYLGLGLARVMQGRWEEALAAFDSMLALQPGYAEGHKQTGCLLRDLGHHDSAITHLREAIRLAPDDIAAIVYLANILIYRGRMEEALALCDHGLSRHPGHPEAIASRALILEKQNRPDAAWECLRLALPGTSDSSGFAIVYARLAPRYGESGRAKLMLEDLLARRTWAPSQRRELHHALANLHDGSGEYDTAFTHYQAANALSPHRFEPEDARRKAEEIMGFFSEENLPEADAAPQGAPVPLFIVGMPRSGTSLVEQMLACHPEVTAAGELEILENLERRMPELLGRTEPYPGCLRGATREAMNALAKPYRDAIAAIASGARYVSDKLPGNYERIGLIRKLFPDARIIHVFRDPRDTCLSCYFQNFGKNLTYSSNLRSLGAVYGIYQRLMDHWRSTPGSGMLDIRYETLVTDPEREVRKLLEFCALPWEARCLEFHKSDRYVNTASYAQVRQPLYQSAIGRWRHYETHIGALIEALG
ncbi:MAG: sulfotransferase [Gammaproteobacteria bacterium]|nr:sulfotransferase [Gammaproteobacteria bacterium]